MLAGVALLLAVVGLYANEIAAAGCDERLTSAERWSDPALAYRNPPRPGSALCSLQDGPPRRSNHPTPRWLLVAHLVLAGNALVLGLLSLVRVAWEGGAHSAVFSLWALAALLLYAGAGVALVPANWPAFARVRH